MNIEIVSAVGFGDGDPLYVKYQVSLLYIYFFQFSSFSYICNHFSVTTSRKLESIW